MDITSKWKYAAGLMLAAVTLLSTRTALADDLTSDSRRALQQLVAQNPADRLTGSTWKRWRIPRFRV